MTPTETIVDVPYLALIPLLPLIGAVLNGMFGMRLQQRFGRLGVGLIGVACPGPRAQWR